MSILDKPIKFVDENEDPKKVNKPTKFMQKAFCNDQRNVLYFAIALGLPGLIMAFFGMWYTAKGSIGLMIFSAAITLFVIWVFWKLIKLLS